MEIYWLKIAVSSLLINLLSKATLADKTLSPCFANSDCDDDQCCALKVKFFTTGFCLRRKYLGEVCNPFIKVGKHFTCGCMIGLTCAVVEEDKHRYIKYRCVRVPTESPEMKENPRHVKTSDDKGLKKSRPGSPEVELLKRYLKKMNRKR